MIRIGLYLSFPPDGGGAFQYAYSILEALERFPASDYQVAVAYSHPAWQTRILDSPVRMRSFAVQEGLLDECLRVALRFGFPVSVWRVLSKRIHPLTRRLLSEAADIWIFPAQDVWTYAAPVPAVGVIHDLMHRYESTFPEVSCFGVYNRRERHYKRICRYAKAVAVDSHVGKAHLLESYPVADKRVCVLPYIAPSYIYGERESLGIQQKYQLPERFFFYPAQFWKHKNHIGLLQAFALIEGDIPDFHLVLVGAKKNAFAEVEYEIARLDLVERVHILGYVPNSDMAAFYRHARALIMPTFFGPTNIPPLEAMAVGCPVAISGIYGIPEQVGDAALLFDPNSEKQIANAMLRLATEDDLCVKLAHEGRNVSRRWGIREFSDRLKLIVESCIEEH